ncbi:MAG: radical SAM protein, partial [Candidatus Omnitrophica bacterium]|nr:radical SAM protein [Candidatus Omnitrophota bacterium]
MQIKQKAKLVNSFIRAKVTPNHFFPLFVGLSLTRRCNYKCKYCNEWNNLCEELTTKQIFSIIDELSLLGTVIIGLDGGEPLLREDLSSIIKYAKKKNFIVSLNTNGSLVPDKISEIKDVDFLDISFDGPEEIHDFARGRKSYKEVMSAVEVVKKNSIPLKFNCTLSKYNINHIDFILKKAEELGIEVKFRPLHTVHFWKDEKILESLYPSKDDYKKGLETIINYKKNNKSVANSLSSLRYIKSWPLTEKKINCFAGKFLCRIEPNGDVYPCTMVRHRTKPINCLDCGLKKAFDELPDVNCEGCWCMGTLELNYLLSLDIGTIRDNINLLRSVSFKN